MLSSAAFSCEGTAGGWVHARSLWKEHSLLQFCVICVICGLLLSCAAQSPPRPPRVERPLPVRDLAAEQVGSAIQLRFGLPTEAVDGSDLTKPLEVEVFRSVQASGAVKASPAFGPSSLSLEPGDFGKPDAEGRVEYSAQLKPDEFKRSLDHVFDFDVRTLTRGFRGRPIESDASNLARLTLLDVPQPPHGLTVDATQDALNLHWSAPDETMTGKACGPISAYRVFRTEQTSGGGRTPYRSIGEARETSFGDTNFEFGRSYSYKVRALVTVNGVSAESDDSASVEIVPRDVFPPAAPAGLTGLYTSGAVELIWSPNPERDLAGYNIRRREDGQKPERLNQELLRSPIYRDTAVTSGHHYFYQVTAVDTNGNESAPSSEIEIEVP